MPKVTFKQNDTVSFRKADNSLSYGVIHLALTYDRYIVKVGGKFQYMKLGKDLTLVERPVVTPARDLSIMDEFQMLAGPLMKFIQERLDLHHTAIIGYDYSRIVCEIIGIPLSVIDEEGDKTE